MKATHRNFSFGRLWGNLSHAPGRCWLCDIAFRGVFMLTWTIRPTRLAFFYWRGKRIYAAKPFRLYPQDTRSGAA